MPDNWVTPMSTDTVLAHELQVSANLRQAYRKAETGRVEVREHLAKLRTALEELITRWNTSEDCPRADEDLRAVLDEHF